VPIITFTAEEIRDPKDSKLILVHDEDAKDCYGESCGSYFEADGVALMPRPHSHLVITGQDPATTPRHYAIPK
jgi:hypothetical protein